MKKKGFLAEFKEFASRGNVVDMAVGVIVGAAFKAIVDSLVGDVVMPLIGIFVDTSSFSEVMIHVGGADILIGNFIGAVINFFLVALVIFCVVKAINTARTRLEAHKKAEEVAEEAAAPPAPTTEELLADILAELRQQRENN